MFLEAVNLYNKTYPLDSRPPSRELLPVTEDLEAFSSASCSEDWGIGVPTFLYTT